MHNKFKLGEMVTLTQGFRTSAAAGDYEITHLLPDNDFGPQYRIKSVSEKHERVARETELSRARFVEPVR